MSNNVHSERAAARRAATLQREKMQKARQAAENARAITKSPAPSLGKKGAFSDKRTPHTGASYSDADYDERLDAAVKLELKKRRRNRRIVMITAVIAMVVGLGYFAFYNITAEKTAGLYNEATSLRDARRGVAVVNINKTEEGEVPDILEEYSLLYSTHRNVIGWLKIEDTIIDYPVMQLNNEFYLDHNYKGEKDKNGAIFMDVECNVLKPSANLILYGHHMRSGNMFGDLNKYANEDYGKKHSRIEFDSIYEKGIYELMYVFKETLKDSADVTFKYYQFIDANSAQEFDSNMAAMAAMSLYNTGVTATFGDRLLTLSTCDHSSTDGRFVVVAKRVDG